MAAPFAAREARVTAAVLAHLSNVEARIETMPLGVVTVSGIFDNGYASAFDGLVGAQQPTFVCDSAAVAQAEQIDTVTIGEVAYSVTNIEPDGVGMTTLRLRKV